MIFLLRALGTARIIHALATGKNKRVGQVQFEAEKNASYKVINYTIKINAVLVWLEPLVS